MGDTRKKGCMVPLSFEVMRIFQHVGFTLKELIIKQQHNCKATGYWKTNSVKYNFLLIAHEYLYTVQKPKVPKERITINIAVHIDMFYSFSQRDKVIAMKIAISPIIKPYQIPS